MKPLALALLVGAAVLAIGLRKSVPPKACHGCAEVV